MLLCQQMGEEESDTFAPQPHLSGIGVGVFSDSFIHQNLLEYIFHARGWGKGQLLFNEYGVPVLEDDKVLEMDGWW